MAFNDQLVFCIDNSREIVQKSSTSIDSQTTPYTIIHRGNQSRRYKIAASQTDDITDVSEELLADSLKCIELQAFLEKAEPLISAQLDRNSNSRTWKYLRESEKDVPASTNKRSFTFDRAVTDENCVTSISWNSIGTMIAASYGQTFHENWCTHASYLVLWNIVREPSTAKEPDYIFETSSCVNCLAFHPKQPSLLACCTFSGDVMVWSLANELTSLLVSRGGEDGGHQDSVNKLNWISPDPPIPSCISSVDEDFFLVTFGADGRIICWNLIVKPEEAILRPVKIFQIYGRDQLGAAIQDQLPKKSMITSLSAASEASQTRSLGIAAAEFSPHQAANLLLGTDSGGLLFCLFQVADWKTHIDFEASHKYPSPVSFVLARFSAPVHSVAWSPFHRNLVAASGAFQGIRFFNIIERTLLFNIDLGDYQIFVIKFLPSEPFLLAAGSENGCVQVVNMRSSQSFNDDQEFTSYESSDSSVHRKFELSSQNSQNSNPILAMEFNSKSEFLLGSGDFRSSVHVLDLEDVKSGNTTSSKISQLEQFLENI